MPRSRISVVLTMLLACMMLISSVHAAELQRFLTMDHPVVIAETVVGNPFAAGTYVFWTDKRNLNLTANSGNELWVNVYGYDLKSGQEFALTQQPADRRTLRSDGQYLVWAEAWPNGAFRVQGMALAQRQERTVLAERSGSDFSAMALAQGVLYYSDRSPGHQGIFAHTLASGQERMITAEPGQVLAADTQYLVYAVRQGGSKGLPSEVTLYLLALDGSSDAQILARDTGELSSVALMDEYVVWSFLPPANDTRVYLYTLSSGSGGPISKSTAFWPVLTKSSVVWAKAPDNSIEQITNWSVERYDLSDGSFTTLAEPSPIQVIPVGIAVYDTVMLLAETNPTHGLRSLHASNVQQSGLRFVEADPSALLQPLAVSGQVYKSGYYLYENGGVRWKVNGVQYILPQTGINGKSFSNNAYDGARNDGSLEFWLEQAQNYLLAKNLRIFVDMPPSSNAPSYDRLNDFLTRASNRGMRVGIILHNSSDWNMTTEKRNWINGLIDYFKNNGGLSRLAYLSADNEINNHCGGSDCFTDQNYVNGAIGWTATFHSLVKAKDSSILTTVGMATEAGPNPDVRAQVRNFFKTDAQGRTLAGIVDFISPHNYGGGGYAVIDEARRFYAGPVVLEEYGYPTDPKPRNALWTEGDPACKNDPGWPASSPNYNLCKNTAPHFIEVNVRAMRDVSTYTGGSAWMIADINNKSCSRDSFDLWTGLFTTSGSYCGGTYTASGGFPKATAFRIRTHHFYY